MSHVLQDLGIDQLPIEQRMVLVQEIWDSIAREVGLLPPSSNEKTEIENRVAEDETSPVDVLTWAGIKSEALKRWGP